MSDQILNLSVKSKHYQGKEVLRDVKFSLQQGEIVSLVGASGCGKSTLLRLIAGLDHDFNGLVEVAGEAPRLHSRHVGFVFQEARLLPWLTVAENVGFEDGARGASHPRVARLLEEVGLIDFAGAYPKHLSGGMAQRASIARGLFNQPKLLLLDEPFSAVDAFTKMRLQDLLLAVAARHNTTVLMVTHDIDEAVYLGNRVLVMTRRPGSVAAVVNNNLPLPRDRRDPELARLKGAVLNLLEAGQPEIHQETQQETEEADQTAKHLIQKINCNQFPVAP